MKNTKILMTLEERQQENEMFHEMEIRTQLDQLFGTDIKPVNQI